VTAPRTLLGLLTIACLSLGCGGGAESGRVSGVVTLDGQPLERARVTFAHESGKFAYGETDSDGRYELQSTGGDKSVPVGEHTVKVSTAFTGRDDQGRIVDFPERVPPRYNEQTELREEVAPGGQEIDLALSTGA